jgi:hypothetical protein
MKQSVQVGEFGDAAVCVIDTENGDCTIRDGCYEVYVARHMKQSVQGGECVQTSPRLFTPT